MEWIWRYTTECGDKLRSVEIYNVDRKIYTMQCGDIFWSLMCVPSIPTVGICFCVWSDGKHGCFEFTVFDSNGFILKFKLFISGEFIHGLILEWLSGSSVFLWKSGDANLCK